MKLFHFLVLRDGVMSQLGYLTSPSFIMSVQLRVGMIWGRAWQEGGGITVVKKSEWFSRILKMYVSTHEAHQVRVSWPGLGDDKRGPNLSQWIMKSLRIMFICVSCYWTKGLTLFLLSAAESAYEGFGWSQWLCFTVLCLFLSYHVCAYSRLHTISSSPLLSSPPAPGRLQHQMSSCQRQSKSDKHVGRTSEENLAACSSAVSARESSYKKHLLHFVLSMMLWKINTVVVCLPPFSLPVCESLCPFVCI